MPNYALLAAKTERSIRKAGAGATCTIRVKTGQHTSGASVVEDFTPHTDIPVVDVGLRDVPGPGGQIVRRQTYLLPGVQLDAAGVDLGKGVFELDVAGRTFRVNRDLGVKVTRPSPGGPTVLYTAEVRG